MMWRSWSWSWTRSWTRSWARSRPRIWTMSRNTNKTSPWIIAHYSLSLEGRLTIISSTVINGRTLVQEKFQKTCYGRKVVFLPVNPYSSPFQNCSDMSVNAILFSSPNFPPLSFFPISSLSSFVTSWFSPNCYTLIPLVHSSPSFPSNTSPSLPSLPLLKPPFQCQSVFDCSTFILFPPSWYLLLGGVLDRLLPPLLTGDLDGLRDDFLYGGDIERDRLWGGERDRDRLLLSGDFGGEGDFDLKKQKVRANGLYREITENVDRLGKKRL